MTDDKIIRLNSYFNVIFSAIDTLSIRKISKLTSIPLNTVRQDLIFLASINCAPFAFDGDNCEDISDDTPLFIFDLVEELSYKIDLSAEEYSFISNLNDTSLTKDKSVPFLIKNNYKYYKVGEIYQILSDFCKAIKINKQVFFSYSGKSGSFSDYITTPVKIIYDNDDNRYSLLCYSHKKYMIFDPEKIVPSFTPEGALDNNSYGSDKYIHILKQNCENLDWNELEKRAPHVWKNDFTTSKPVHVKIQFKDSVYNEIKKDICYHNPDIILSKPRDGYFFLEDDIYGEDAFFSWVRGYGSKAIIYEPERLRKRHIDSLNECLKKYQ